MNSSRFKKSQLKELCFLLKTTPEVVRAITDNPAKYHKEWVEEKCDKTTGKVKTYRDGTVKERVISPSLEPLRSIQIRIKDKILAPIPLPDNIHGGVKGRSNITNGKPHQGKKYQFTTDLQDFFPSISNTVVNATFLKLGFSNHKAYWLTKLITFKYKVPQGAPTSTHIANLVFLDIDRALIKLAAAHDIIYTRYIDDLTFSSSKDFRFVLNEILAIINAGGFNISYRKTKYKGKQTITGIRVFNNYIDAPLKIKEKASLESMSDEVSKPYTNYLKRIQSTNV